MNRFVGRATIVIEIIGIVIFLWMMFVAMNQAFAQGDLSTRVAVQQQRLDSIIGQDGQGGTLSQTNAHIHNTDLEVLELRDFMNKILGGLLGLGGVQTLNLILSAITLKRAK